MFLVSAWLCLTLCDPQTIACQAPLSMGFSRQESWSGLPFLSPRDIPDPGTESRSLALQVDSLLSELPGKSLVTREMQNKAMMRYNCTLNQNG